MTEEKKNPVEQQKTSDTAKTLKDADKVINGEKLSEDELNAVAGAGCGKAAKWQQEQD